MAAHDAPAVALSLAELSAGQWLVMFAFGMAFGAAGQVIRAVGGVKKINDEAEALRTTTGELFDTGRFLRSLLIGGVAGFLAVLATVDVSRSISVQVVLGIMAAGYAGADFIEAFARKHLPEMSRDEAEVKSQSGSGKVSTNTQDGLPNTSDPPSDDALG